MNFSDIKYCDLINGTGIGVSLFVSGCNINCPGCFNKKAQNFNFGHSFNQDTMDSLLRGGCNNNIDHLSILGGEPLDKANYPEVLQVVKAWKAIHPNKPIWLWTGYNISEVEEYTKEVYKYLDFIIDGPYRKDIPTNKPFRGSDNQRLLKKVGKDKNEKFSLLIGHEHYIIVS